MLSSSLLKSYDYLIELMLINPFDKQMWVELRMHFRRVWSEKSLSNYINSYIVFSSKKNKTQV